MKIYEYDDEGLFKQAHELLADEIPDHFENMTEVAPPDLGEGYQARFNGADWTIEGTRLPC